MKTRENKRDLKHVFDHGRQTEVGCFPIELVFYKYLQYLITAKDDLFENVGGTTALSFEMFTSGLRSCPKSVARFNSLTCGHLPEIPLLRLKMTPNPWALVKLSSAYVTK